ncbi:S-adenosyl-L-methionine-dependent methyltransferase [Xylariaceae sp. FL0255]|nr:S-adenosyl-L-methionine-dependent methyltransferase [Xylariaceae sp. FL0255]
MGERSDYIFTRDYLDNNRINLGHYQFRELFGYLLHPSIPTNNATLRVADVATGTGIWLMDMSTRLPSTAKLEGLDLSFQATPPAEWLPPNVVLRKWNVRDAPPEDLIGAYDIVHVRYLCLVLSDAEVPRVLENIAQLIKPGGYLQWGELDTPSFRIEKTHTDNDASALTRIYDLEQSQDARLNPTWVSRLPELFRGSGFSDVVSDVRDPPGYMAWAMHETMLMIHDLIAQTTGNEVIAKGIEETLPEVVKQGKKGACWAFTRWIVVGRKPLKG